MVKTSDPAYVAVRERLRIARERLAVSQEEVARQLRRPQSYVSKCELGEPRVDVIELAALADCYGQALTYFTGKTAWQEPPAPSGRRRLGRLVALEGDTLVVGARQDEPGGASRVRHTCSRGARAGGAS